MRSGDLPAAVRAGWGLPVEDVRPTDGGMNSITWYLRSHGNSYVAKWVPRDEADALQVGCEAAMELAELGLRTGPPRPTLDGGLATEAGGGLLALIEKVPGAPLTGETDRERRTIGQLLGRVHAATRCARPGHSFPLWLRFDSSSLDLDASGARGVLRRPRCRTRSGGRARRAPGPAAAARRGAGRLLR